MSASLAGVACTKYATRLFRDKRRAYIGISLLTAVTIGLFHFIGPSNIGLLFGLQIVGSFISGPLMPLTWAMFADTADYAEYRFGRRSTGLIFSAGTFSQKFGWTIGGAAAGWMLAWFGFKANLEQAPDTLHGIVLLMGVVPAAIAALTAVGVLFYKIDGAMEKEIEAAVLKHAASK